ncbi:MAG TPA: glutathione S-transferase family protein [Rhizomicrobium sp.]|nr:glutathione S-transferase family protein [Rhizomicrobium sp.]
MTYTIYGDLRSGAFSSEAALAEAGAPYTFELISIEKNAQKSPAFLAINPSGKMPALKTPDGQIVTESLAILLTVADRFPAADLLPAPGSPARADVYRWLAFMAGEIYPMVEISDFPERFVPTGVEADTLRAKARSRIRENLLLIERMLNGPWFLGETFSALDIYAVMFTRWRGTVGRDWLEGGHIPKLHALAERLSKRERIAPVWQRHFAKD